MFDFGNTNSEQREAIRTSNGPVLIIAGPGTGKTHTLVRRTLYLIMEHGVAPEHIMIATFTEKAAKELITRITNILAEHDIVANINDMYIGTMHSICLRFIKEHLEHTRLKKNYKTLDDFDQKYIIFRNLHRFKSIENYDEVVKAGGWRASEKISMYVNNLTEELVLAEELIADGNPEIVALGNILETYHGILSDNNMMDFSSIQVEAYMLLRNNPSILERIRERIRYIMIDEYQDTNYIQEQIIFLLGGTHENICVVGDDDQGLYRFRGATVRNILEFPNKFEEGKCKKISLTTNYRSNSDIVDFYNDWMETTCEEFRWGGFRYSKTIEAHEQTSLKSPSVVRLYGIEDEEEWHSNITSFIQKMYDTGTLTDYNQIAFLCRSVKNKKITRLMGHLEKNGIDVYSPRAGMFFDREEVILMLGCLMLLFPEYVKGLDKKSYEYLKREHYDYYSKCIRTASETLRMPESKELFLWLREKGIIHAGMSGKKNRTMDYAYSGLIYQLFKFDPFRKIIECDMSKGVIDLRAIRNISSLTRLVTKYEHLHNISVLDGRQMDRNTERLFNTFFKLLFDEGAPEFEDESEYAPSGCISFLTIHQSKGMEFPVVFVDSLSDSPKKTYDSLLKEIEKKYYHRKPFEPYDEMKYFDFWRLYYTAFSRAQDLLVLTCNETEKSPSRYLSPVYETLQNVNNSEFDVSDFDLNKIKDANLKHSFSFTSHISVYETCSLQYKFYKELEFAPVRAGAMMFGRLVHQTIEDVHHAALRNEEHTITIDNLRSWFDANYNSLSKSEHVYLLDKQKDAAFDQIQRYVERQQGKWDTIKESEVSVSLVKPEYIVEGTIDLIKGDGNTVEIVDFKAEKKPDLFADNGEKVEQYRRQLHLYAHMIEERTRQKVSKMHLYFTGEDTGNPLLSFPYSRTAIDSTVIAFENTVQKILNKDFSTRSNDSKVCGECDFRHFCKMDKD